MFKYTSRLIKGSAYIFLFWNIYRQVSDIAFHTSYLNTGKLMGVESMLQMLWACFVSFLVSAIIYGFGVIVQFHEKDESTDLTKSKDDVK